MLEAIETRSHPERGLRVVHVAGTNGKGSVCSMIEAALRNAGLRTGWFTSPHLHQYAERFRIDGQPLSDDEVGRRLKDQREAKLDLTFFEHATLLGLEAFRDHACDVVVLEVGLGGRLDSTNIVGPDKLAVITRIALEHTRILGDTHALIAGEKAGILKRGCDAVVGARHPDAVATIRAQCDALGVPALFAGEDFELVPRVGGVQVEPLGLEGEFQIENAAIALAALRAFRERESCESLTDEVMVAGLKEARWPGRLERIDARGREFLFDCAHNPDGCAALGSHMRTLPPKSTTLLFGAMSDKDHEAMLAAFDGQVAGRIYAIPPMRRAPEDLSIFTDILPGEIAPSVAQGLERAIRTTPVGGRIVVAGSIFLVDEVRATLLGLPRDPPIAM